MTRALALVIWLGLAGAAGAQPAGSAGSSAGSAGSSAGSAETAETGSAEPVPLDELPPPHGYREVPRLSEGLSNGQHVPLPEVHLSKPERQTDRRPVYVGAGIVVLAAIFWLNRRQRDRFEREDRTDDRADDARDDEEST